MLPASRNGSQPTPTSRPLALWTASQMRTGSFDNRQRRALQRLAKSWRAKTARLLIEDLEAVISIELPASVPAGRDAAEHVTNANPALGNIAP